MENKMSGSKAGTEKRRSWLLKCLVVSVLLLVVGVASWWVGYTFRGLQQEIVSKIEQNVEDPQIVEASILLSALRDLRAGDSKSAKKTLESRLDGIVITLSASSRQKAKKMLYYIKEYRAKVDSLETGSTKYVRKRVDEVLKSLSRPQQ